MVRAGRASHASRARTGREGRTFGDASPVTDTMVRTCRDAGHMLARTHPARRWRRHMAAQGSVFVGKTLDEAVRKGLEALGLRRAEVMITMLEEGSGGFLGLGARPFKVRIVP